MASKKATKKITETGISIEFETGQTLDIELSSLSDEMQKKLALHGLSQKVGDSYAGAEADESFELAAAVHERLKNNDWTVTRAGGGAARVSMLVEALAAATGKDPEETLAVVSAMDDDAKKQLKKHPAIAAELARLSAERAVEKAKAAAASAAASPVEPINI